MRELLPGLWHWDAPHPDWEGSVRWGQVVSSYAIDDGDRLLLFDPIAPPSEIDDLAASRKTVIVLTAPWHERDTRSLVERLGTPSYLRPTLKTTSCGSTASLPRRLLGAAPTWPGCSSGTRARRTCTQPAIGCPSESRRSPEGSPNDLVLWIENRRALVVGDTLIDFGHGLEISPVEWLPEVEWLLPGVTREQIAERLRPLLALPVEHVLATHGGPIDRAALERALSSS